MTGRSIRSTSSIQATDIFTSSADASIEKAKGMEYTAIAQRRPVHLTLQPEFILHFHSCEVVTLIAVTAIIVSIAC